ncbi:MAG: SIS domain-containing protein [Erysipelotrichaceae bacterium]
MITCEESKLWKEIHEQPQAIRNCLKINTPIFKEIANEVKARGIKTVVFAARGSSDHAAQAARYLFETYCGMVASIATPSVITCYNGNVDYSNVLLIGVSQSGGAQDVYQVMKRCDEQGGICVSITNVEGSLMNTIGKYRMNNECGVETSITAAKSYITQLTMLTGIAAYISNNSELISKLDHLADIVEESMQLENQVKAIIPVYRNCEHMLVFGRGLLYGLAQETELKVQEASYFDARAYASSDYRHGPIATSLRFVPAMFFIADTPTNNCIITLHERLKKEKDIYSTIVTNLPDIAASGDTSILLPSHIEGLYAVYACTVISQMFCCLLALARGYNPDEPVGVSKQTVTI